MRGEPMASVYVETSIFGSLVERRRDVTSRYQREEATAWWEFRDRYDLYISQAVINELSAGSYPGQELALRLASIVPQLEITEEIRALSKDYRRLMIMPDREVGDALHLATACVYGVDYLVTWNCKHLANVNKTERLLAIHAQLGRPMPRIVTPPMLE